MNNLPKISVVTITYGHQDYITETLDGVLMQQYEGPVEFIIANDNSPDNTDKVVKDYLARNKIPENFEIKYTKHHENIGMMPNFIWALNQATGKYIALCEGDDYWTDVKKLEKQICFLEGNLDFSICYHQVNQKNETGIQEYEFDLVAEQTIFNLKNLCEANIMSTPSVVYRNISKLPDFVQNLYPGDYALHIINAMRGKIKYIDGIMAVYRIHYQGIHSTGISIENKLKFRNSLLILSNYLSENKFYVESKILKNRYIQSLTFGAGLNNDSNLSVMKRLLLVLRYMPIKSKIKILLSKKRNY